MSRTTTGQDRCLPPELDCCYRWIGGVVALVERRKWTPSERQRFFHTAGRLMALHLRRAQDALAGELDTTPQTLYGVDEDEWEAGR